MKRRLKYISYSVIFIFVLLSLAPGAWAGLIHHKIKVTNPTAFNATIHLRMGNGHAYSQDIPAGGSYTFEVGKKCAAYLYGLLLADTGTVQIAKRCMLTGQEGAMDACFPECASSAWKIAKRGDGAYHFNKD